MGFLKRAAGEWLAELAGERLLILSEKFESTKMHDKLMTIQKMHKEKEEIRAKKREEQFFDYQRELTNRNPNNIHLWGNIDTEFTRFSTKQYLTITISDIEGNNGFRGEITHLDKLLDGFLMNNNTGKKQILLSEIHTSNRDYYIKPAKFHVSMPNVKGIIKTTKKSKHRILQASWNKWTLEYESHDAWMLLNEQGFRVATLSRNKYSYFNSWFIDFPNWENVNEVLAFFMAMIMKKEVLRRKEAKDSDVGE